MNEHIHHGCPIVEGTLKDNVSVNHNAYVGPYAVVQGNAYVRDGARIEGNAVVDGNAEIHDAATIKGNAVVDGNARVGGNFIVGGHAHVGGEASLSGEGSVGGFADINSDDDYVVIRGLTPHPLTVYKSSVWGFEVSLRGQWETSIENFLEFERLPGNVKKIIELIAQKWKK